MVIGSACLFTFSFILAAKCLDRFTGEDSSTFFDTPVYLGIVLAFFIFLPFLRQANVRRMVGLVNVLLALIWLSFFLYFSAQNNDFFQSQVISVIGLVMYTILLMQWNLHYTLNKVENAAMIVWTSTILSVILILLFLNNSYLLPLPFVCVLPLISALCSWWLESNESANPKSANSVESISEYDKKHFSTETNPKRTRWLFFSVRIGLSFLYGLAFGSFATNPGALVANKLLVFSLIGIAVTSLLIPMLLFRDKPLPIYFIVALPVLIAFGLLTVYLGSDVTYLANITVGIAGLVGQVFFYSQMPTYREMTKLDLVSFSYLEKASTLIPFAITARLTQLILTGTNAYSLYSTKISQVIVYYMLMMVIVYSATLMRHLLLYFPRQQKQLALEDTGGIDNFDDMEKTHTVAQRHALTKRESEVLAYLAKGYSRLYIEKKLYISKGTAKTHIFRIFQKLGVSSQDELIELVEQG
jgi:DNA-binding CsgD family transcriptional regulator